MGPRHAGSAALFRTLLPRPGGVNHDDDVLRIDAFVDGQRVVHYDSRPDYFGEDSDEDVAPAGGEHLAALFGAVESEVEAWRGPQVVATGWSW